jgi:hypothetical protein
MADMLKIRSIHYSRHVIEREDAWRNVLKLYTKLRGIETRDKIRIKYGID